MPKKSLMECLTVVPDPRINRTKKHNLIDILVITICGVLSGCEEWVEIEDYGLEKLEWLGQFLELPNGIPSHDTFGRVFSLLSPEAFQKAFLEWLRNFKEVFEREAISIDGKFLRGALREKGKETSAILVVSAWAQRAGLCLGQEKTELKKDEGEKRATESLLEELYLKGCIVTLDAMGASPRITAKIIEKEGDYVVGLKSNQRVLLRFANSAFAKSSSASYRTENNGHGRKEVREYWQIDLLKFDFGSMSKGWKNLQKKWPHLKSFVKVTANKSDGINTTEETRYFFTSMESNLEEAAQVIRGHWAVENTLHWSLDVTFREDHSRVRIGHAAENLALVRRMALNILKHQEPQKSIKRKRRKCGWDNRYLLEALISQPSI